MNITIRTHNTAFKTPFHHPAKTLQNTNNKIKIIIHHISPLSLCLSFSFSLSKIKFFFLLLVLQLTGNEEWW
ncbi:hypothetical protein QVD17_39645 [Tagetes erecta]|uniref:Uncharacterized protein n=1 Tax=Tagetes erecta TaxID=13708 RepID=A0AAD8NAC5_TARER|nr:hypothetical protein QVD17_39645 [Tagetes erecta]